MDYKEKIKNLPGSPGVYIMKDSAGAILYVGKAINVKKRVASYFYPNRRLPERLTVMVARIEKIDCVPTATEAEALIYENSLIKQLSPKYNVALRDDKSYPRLKLTVNERFPRLFITRKKLDDGALYFGPYTNGRLLREALMALRQIFPLRSCGKMAKSPCLNYHIQQCLAPCAGKIDDDSYGEIVAELKLFLDKGRPGLLRSLSEKMADASAHERFEEAAKIRSRIEALGSMKESSITYVPQDELDELKSMLGLSGRIGTIEAFDISNIMGQEAVGSMISFHDGKPRKSEYRKFRIRTVSGVDDYAMMREVVGRRYSRLLEEKRSLPDLILIDGGRGHLSVASEELERLGITGVPVIGIAKEFEHVYVKGRKAPVILPRDSKALHLLERVRDEAHRFAITYHASLRSKRVGLSELDRISGIGPKRKKALLEHFGSVEKIRTASLEELASTGGVSEEAAKNIVEYFKRSNAGSIREERI